MTRLIDADAFKKILSEHEMKHDKRRSFDDYDCGAANAYEHASDLLDDMSTVERPHGEWIPCSERLPEESLDSVIGWDRFRERCVFVQYMDGHFQITGKQESFDVIAWMPLPKPYEKEGEAE